jgi:hypothetical protein
MQHEVQQRRSGGRRLSHGPAGQIPTRILRCALADRRAGREVGVTTTRAIREWCDAMRARQLPASSIVRSLARAWLSSDAMRELPPTEARVLLDRLITASVRTFYSIGSPH